APGGGITAPVQSTTAPKAGGLQPPGAANKVPGQPGGANSKIAPPRSTTAGPGSVGPGGHDPGKPAAPATPAPWVRAERAVKVLEQIGTPDALQILQTLAQGEPEALPTRAAKEAPNGPKK